MKARVRFFARLSEIAGVRETEVEVGEGMPVGDVFASLVERWPEMAGLEPSLLYAVNAEYVARDHSVRPGDELALIPPVSGGSADSGALDPSLSERRRAKERCLQMNGGQVPNDRARDDSEGPEGVGAADGRLQMSVCGCFHSTALGMTLRVPQDER